MYHGHDHNPWQVQFLNDGVRQSSLATPGATSDTDDTDISPWWTVMRTLCYGVAATTVLWEGGRCCDFSTHIDCLYKDETKEQNTRVGTNIKRSCDSKNPGRVTSSENTYKKSEVNGLSNSGKRNRRFPPSGAILKKTHQVGEVTRRKT